MTRGLQYASTIECTMGYGTGGADQGFYDNWLMGGWDTGNLGIASQEERKQGVKLTGYSVILSSNTLKP